ncbi:MAG: EAL domain-containing protein, partial [Acetobacter papayae]
TGHQHQMGASVGIAFSPEHGTQSSLLLSRADMALYAAKAGGKNTARVFLPQMEDSVLMRARLERMLRDAFVHSRDMFVFYQPIVDLTSGQVVSREALMRWYDSSRGWIPPKDFIPVAEEAGLVYDLDSFVLHAACRDAAIWADEASVAVNISAASVGQGRLPGAVAMALAASGLPAARLSVEITETALMSGGNEALRDLQALRDMGVGISLDDFGTGFSSLAHLRAFPFDRIKIDGSFVQDGDRRSDCAAIVRALAQLGVTLRVATVAEGVETPQQRQRIQADGCTHAQGYLFGRPEPALRDLSRLKAINALHVC